MIPVLVLAALAPSCTNPKTYYRPDGTPYSQDEFDAAETLIVLLIIGGLVGLAASQSETRTYGP